MKPAKTEIQGIPCYAPDLAIENDGYPSTGFENYFKYEEGSFWFRTRNQLIEYLFKKYTDQSVKQTFMEIGCGTGYVLKGLSKLPNAELIGSEIYVNGLTFAQKRLPQVKFVQLDARDMPFENEIDNIGAFDVLEHIEEDEAVMKSVYTALKPGGKFYISVPQHQFLWSNIDEYLCHKRRYSRSEMLGKLRAAGFEIRWVSSYVFTLFPAMAISRLLKKKAPASNTYNKTVQTEIVLPKFLDSLMDGLMGIDKLLIKMGLSLPVGGSLYVVAVKK